MLDPTKFSLLVMGQLLKRGEEIFHPHLYRQTLQEIGVTIGRQLASKMPALTGPPVREQEGNSRPFKQENYRLYKEWIQSFIGWVRDVEMDEDASSFKMSIAHCPFQHLTIESPDLCQIAASVIGGVAGDYFGYAKVSISNSLDCPPKNCCLTVHLKQTPESLLVEGLCFPLDREKQLPAGKTDTEERLLAPLSLRERQIIRFLGEGLSDKEIADTLSLSVRTVEGHIARIREKLGPRSRSSLIRLGLKSNRYT
jgi:DNA-binding CsgD family transcriptional regulator